MSKASVISLDSSRLRRRSKLWRDYYRGLSFGQIIDERAPTVQQLWDSPGDEEAILRATELLKEYQRRLIQS